MEEGKFGHCAPHAFASRTHRKRNQTARATATRTRNTLHAHTRQASSITASNGRHFARSQEQRRRYTPKSKLASCVHGRRSQPACLPFLCGETGPGSRIWSAGGAGEWCGAGRIMPGGPPVPHDSRSRGAGLRGSRRAGLRAFPRHRLVLGGGRRLPPLEPYPAHPTAILLCEQE
jgi:hypothetical protein